MDKLSSLREEIEDVNRQIQDAQQKYDLNKAAELQYGRLPELQKELEAEEEKVKERGSVAWFMRALPRMRLHGSYPSWTGIPGGKADGERAEQDPASGRRAS